MRKDGGVVGHIPKGLASTKQGTAIVKHFLAKTGCKAEVKVVGNAVNRGGGYGMVVWKSRASINFRDRKYTSSC